MAGEAKSSDITLPDLPYDFSALEPHIDETTMRTHHDFHHAGYTSKFKKAYEDLCKNEDLAQFAKGGITGVVQSATLDALRQAKGGAGPAGALQNNGGGWINHSLFWKNMAPAGNGGGGEPTGDLAAAIKDDFGSFDEFKAKFKNAGATRFGSGWAWLVVKPSAVGVDGNKHGLVVYSTANQDGPHNNPDETPLLGLDVWEHAYYLKYKNKRAAYIDAFWNVTNWPEVAQRYAGANK